jgi:predicted DNA-binding protein (MmcQ/YjbR family)
VARSAKAINSQLLDYALTFPGAWVDHPWGENVVKVGKKVFVFFGTEDTRKGHVGVGVKLPSSADAALDLPGVEIMGYGMGRAGWVWARFTVKETPPVELLCDWIEESYRTIAPKKLIKELDEAAE